MPTFCIQCALEAFVKGKGASVPPEMTMFEETPEEHMKRVHPDPVATQNRRQELEQEAAEIMAQRGSNDV